MTFFPRLFSVVMVFTAAMFMVVQDADARRFGGGRSMGRSSSMAKPVPPARSQSSNTQQPAQRSGMSRFMGPLAGLAAGGLLAAMFMGGGFEGIQFFDILLIGGLIFGGIWLFRRMKAGSGAGMQRQQHAVGAGAGGGHPAGFQVPDIGSAVGGGAAGGAPGGLSQEAPKWFDKAGFLNGAKQQFITMQKAWDNRDIDKIRETVTADLFTELMQEMDTMGDNHTEVVTLNSELLGFTHEPDRIVVSVRMSGLIKEEIGGQPQPFDEAWHVQRATNDPKANWYVAGIQQND